MKFRVAGHMVLVETQKIEEEKVSPGGIVYKVDNKDGRLDKAQDVGKILQVGPTAWKMVDDGTPWAKVGDTVYFQRYAGKYIDPEDLGLPGDKEAYRVIFDTDVILVSEGDHDE